MSSPAVDSARPSTTDAADAPPARFAALQSRNFRLIWVGLLVSNAGTWMETTALGWLVTDLEPDRAPFWLGVMAAALALPLLVLFPVGGAIADRVSRLRLLWFMQSMFVVCSAVLAAVTLLDAVEIWMLVAYSAVIGVVLAFDSPVRHALLPEIVTRDQLASGVSLNSVAFTGAALAGPAVAGPLIPLIGVAGVLVVSTLSRFSTLFALARLKGVDGRARSTGPDRRILDSIASAVRYIGGSPLLSGLILVSGISGFLARSYGPLLAVFARDVYGVGSTAYGAMISAGGLGTLVGAFLLAGRREVERKGRLVAIASILQALLLLLFAVSPWYGATLPLLALAGATSAVAGAMISTLIQLSVPNDLRGRVMSIYLLTVVAIPSMGSFLLGAVAVQTGIRWTVASAAAIVVVAVVLLFGRNRALRAEL